MGPTHYLAGILSIFGMVCLSLVTLELGRPGGEWNSNTFHAIVGSAGTIIAVFLTGIKSVQNGKSLEHLHKCYHSVEEKADLAARESAEAKQHAVIAATTAVETKKDILQAITNGTPKKIEADVTVHQEGK